MAPSEIDPVVAALACWPKILDEDRTLEMIESGWSIGRFGDGELKCIEGRGYVSQRPDSGLAAELRTILGTPAKLFLPCVPTMDQRCPGYAFWPRLAPRFLPHLDQANFYGSAFVGRRDLAPWIDRLDYVTRWRALWTGKRVAIVAPPLNKLVRQVPNATHVVCPSTDAYDSINALVLTCLRLKPDLVLLSAGPTATCAAHRLSSHGVQALDVGRLGGLLLKRPC